MEKGIRTEAASRKGVSLSVWEVHEDLCGVTDRTFTLIAGGFMHLSKLIFKARSLMYIYSGTFKLYKLYLNQGNSTNKSSLDDFAAQ